MKIKGFVHAVYEQYDKKWEYTIYSYDMSHMNGFGVVVAESFVEFEPPETHELVNKTIAAMKSAQKEIRAKAEASAQNIEQQIQELLCIEDRSAA